MDLFKNLLKFYESYWSEYGEWLNSLPPEQMAIELWINHFSKFFQNII